MFHSTGIFDKYEKEDFMKKILHQNFKKKKKENQLKVESIAPILKITAILYLISMFILFFEKIYWHMFLNSKILKMFVIIKKKISN